MSGLQTVRSVAVMLALVSALSSQNVNQKLTVKSITNQENVLAVFPWNVDGANLLCIVGQPNSTLATDSSSSTKTLTIYKINGSQLTRVFEAQTGDWFLSAYPIKEEGRLLVSWGSGSAHHFHVYGYRNGKVQELLEADSRGMPEITFDDEGRESLLFTNEKLVNGEWKNSAGATSVFKWDGREYEKIGTVPWAKRLSCLSKQPCVEMK